MAKVYDEENLDLAFEKYSDMVMRICYMKLRNSEDAKDALQEVFIKFYTLDKTFDSEEHMKAWLIRVAINKCNDLQKSFWSKNTQSITDVDIVFNQEIETDVMDAVLSLPQKYRDAIYLFYYEGYTVPEISTILDQKENTVYSNLHRAKKELKEKLGDDSYDEAF